MVRQTHQPGSMVNVNPYSYIPPLEKGDIGGFDRTSGKINHPLYSHIPSSFPPSPSFRRGNPCVYSCLHAFGRLQESPLQTSKSTLSLLYKRRGISPSPPLEKGDTGGFDRRRGRSIIPYTPTYPRHSHPLHHFVEVTLVFTLAFTPLGDYKSRP